jgi:RHS repeat-associated protein
MKAATRMAYGYAEVSKVWPSRSNGERDYDPAVGKYVESDPIGLAAGINTYGYVGGNPISYTDPLGLFITSVDAACAIDPNFCAGILGQIVQNAATISGNSCEQEAADAVSEAVHTTANIASFFLIAKNLSRFEQKLPAARRPAAIRNLPNGGKAFQGEVPETCTRFKLRV